MTSINIKPLKEKTQNNFLHLKLKAITVVVFGEDLIEIGQKGVNIYQSIDTVTLGHEDFTQELLHIKIFHNNLKRFQR